MESTKVVRPNIAFAGLTAAGKTTHAKILAEQLGYEYISATQTILEILDMQNNPDKVWFTNYEEIEKAREGDKVDVELEARMTELMNKKDGLILDIWAMAWLYDGTTPLIRLWIESDQDSRTRKCFVSQGSNQALGLHECRELIDKKDGDTRNNFQRRLNFDLFNDKQKYDLILNNTLLIPEPTEFAAKQGIATFAPIVNQAVQYCIDRINSPGFDHTGERAQELIAKSNGMITYLRQA